MDRKYKTNNWYLTQVLNREAVGVKTDYQLFLLSLIIVFLSMILLRSPNTYVDSLKQQCSLVQPHKFCSAGLPANSGTAPPHTHPTSTGVTVALHEGPPLEQALTPASVCFLSECFQALKSRYFCSHFEVRILRRQGEWPEAAWTGKGVQEAPLHLLCPKP